MIPVLYNHSEKEFTSNGLGRLTECTSCIVTEERNGVFECEFTYPISGRHYQEIAEGCIIFVTHDNSGIPQPFDVYKRSVPINGEVTFYAAHVSYRLGKTVLMPYTAASCASALSGIKAHCVPECEFNFVTDKIVDGNFELKKPTAAKAILCGVEGSILDVFGTGEYKFDRFLVSLYLHRGKDTDVQIRYGKNLVDMTDELDSSGSYTAVIPYWENPETGEVKTLPEGAVLADDVPLYFDYWTDENGRRITNENNNEFEFAYADITAVSLDLSTAYETQPTDAQMREKAKESANAHKLYSQSLSVDFVQLAQSEEYKDYAPLQELNLCDTCEVIYNNNPVRLKVIRTEYDTLKDRYSKIELGDPPANYADVLTGELNEKIELVPTKSEMRLAIDAASNTIKGVNGGNVVFRYQNGKPYEILIMDTDDVATAVNVLRINMNGIGFSHSGVDGDYLTAWTLDGRFVADFIQAGTLSANLIRSGVLTATDGLSSWDLNNSIFNNKGTRSRVQMTDGKIEVFVKVPGYAEEKCWSIRPFTSSYELRGAIMAAEVGDIVALGRVDPDDSSKSYYTLGVNNGLNPYGYTEKILAFAPIRARNGIYFGTTINEVSSSRIQDKTFTVSGVEQAWLVVRGYRGIYFTMGSPQSDSIPQKAQDDDYRIVFKQAVFVDDWIYASGEVHGTKFVSTSDENLKNIRPYDRAYDEALDDLEPVSFTWKADDTKQYIGLGARQTQRILEAHGIENAGFVDERGGDYGINYQELSVMLLKRVQDQTKQIKDLSARLERLEALLANT